MWIVYIFCELYLLFIRFEGKKLKYIYIYTVIYNVQISSLLLNKHAYVNWIYLEFVHVFYHFYILKSVLHCSLQLVSIGMSSSFSLVSYVYKPIIWIAIYKLYFTYICSLIYNISIIFYKTKCIELCVYICTCNEEAAVNIYMLSLFWIRNSLGFCVTSWFCFRVCVFYSQVKAAAAGQGSISPLKSSKVPTSSSISASAKRIGRSSSSSTNLKRWAWPPSNQLSSNLLHF